MPYADEEKNKQAKREYEKKRAPRYENWEATFYEEDCPDWQNVIRETRIKVLVSPLHDEDEWTMADERKNPEHKAGTKKKPHRHIIMRYEGSKATAKEVLEDFKALGIRVVRHIKNLPGMVQYLTHDNEPDKHHYNHEDVLEFNGASYALMYYQSVDFHKCMRDMRKACSKYFIDFYVFYEWCDENNPEWSYVLDDKCYSIEKFLKSKRATLANRGELETAAFLQPEPWVSDCQAWVDDKKRELGLAPDEDEKARVAGPGAGPTASPAPGNPNPEPFKNKGEKVKPQVKEDFSKNCSQQHEPAETTQQHEKCNKTAESVPFSNTEQQHSNTQQHEPKPEPTNLSNTEQQHDVKCPKCGSDWIKMHGRTLAGSQRYYCHECHSSFVNFGSSKNPDEQSFFEVDKNQTRLDDFI